MKKELLLLFVSAVCTLFLGLGMVRLLAPQLLGAPRDFELVQVDEKVPPFFENIFRIENFTSNEFIVKDPLTKTRGNPFFEELNFLGPHDILGFRNRSVPSVADIVAVGDSQTYGNNAPYEANWPNQAKGFLQTDNRVFYNMSTGGWGAVQYLNIFSKALFFRPRVIVIAFYTGNDPLESFQAAYNIEQWKFLRPDHSLKPSDGPKIQFPPPRSAWWPVAFKDGVKTIFTPETRLTTNLNHPAVRAGYEIMAEVARQISIKALESNVPLIFTIIPTKEMAFEKKVETEGVLIHPKYAELLENEANYIHNLKNQVTVLSGSEYVDVIAPLQKAALAGVSLYPETEDGHPVPKGYEVIAKTLAPFINKYLKPGPKGLLLLNEKGRYVHMLSNEDGLWTFNNTALVTKNGWEIAKARQVTLRDLTNIPRKGTITEVSPGRFGPR